MKKQYQQPQIKVVRLEIHHMLAASPSEWDGELGAPGYEPEWDDFEE